MEAYPTVFEKRPKAVERLQDVGIEAAGVLQPGSVSYQQIPQVVRVLSPQVYHLIRIAADALEEESELTQIDIGREAAPETPLVIP
ncbi:MAG: hypothetical protein ACLQAS_06120 [Thermoplasmata archaeon]